MHQMNRPVLTQSALVVPATVIERRSPAMGIRPRPQAEQAPQVALWGRRTELLDMMSRCTNNNQAFSLRTMFQTAD